MGGHGISLLLTYHSFFSPLSLILFFIVSWFCLLHLESLIVVSYAFFLFVLFFGLFVNLFLFSCLFLPPAIFLSYYPALFSYSLSSFILYSLSSLFHESIHLITSFFHIILFILISFFFFTQYPILLTFFPFPYYPISFALFFLFLFLLSIAFTAPTPPSPPYPRKGDFEKTEQRHYQQGFDGRENFEFLRSTDFSFSFCN